MPPEACSDYSKYNLKLDIFSYGHLALFTATQTFPSSLLPVYDAENLTFHTEARRCHKQLQQQLGDHYLIKLIKQCLDNNPKMRPTATEVVHTLEKLVAESHPCKVQ